MMSEEEALERLRNNEITISRAAEVAGVSYQEMMELMAEEGIESGLTAEDLDEDVENLR